MLHKKLDWTLVTLFYRSLFECSYACIEYLRVNLQTQTHSILRQRISFFLFSTTSSATELLPDPETYRPYTIVGSFQRTGTLPGGGQPHASNPKKTRVDETKTNSGTRSGACVLTAIDPDPNPDRPSLAVTATPRPARPDPTDPDEFLLPKATRHANTPKPESDRPTPGRVSTVFPAPWRRPAGYQPRGGGGAL